MFVLGHLGIGSRIARPLMGRGNEALPRRWLLWGTLLPDLIDKPAYYALVLLTGRHAAALAAVTDGIYGGTRTFGHTAFFLLALSATAFATRSRALGALALGTATHLFLDNFQDACLGGADGVALLWPFKGWAFPVSPYTSVGDHLLSGTRPFTLACEALGALLLVEDWLRARGILFLPFTRAARSRRPSKKPRTGR